MDAPLTHHKPPHTPESLVDTVVLPVPIKLSNTAIVTNVSQRRKSSVSITVDGAENLLEAALEGVHQLASQRELSTKDVGNRHDQLKGKKVLFVCCGPDGLDSKRFVFEIARELGVRGILVEDARNTLAITMEKCHLIERFIRSDMTPRLTLIDDVVSALELVSDQIDGFDGVCTFWDDAVSLCARIAAHFHLPGNSVRSVDYAHNKHLTREVLRAAGIPTPASYLLKCENDVQVAAEIVGVPAIMKPMYGGSSLAVMKVEKLEDLFNAYHRVIHLLKKVYDEGELMGLTFNADEFGATFESSSLSWLVIEEFLDGPEVDVDLVLRNGNVVYQCVLDDWPLIQPWFAEMGNNCPSKLPVSEQQALANMAIDACVKAIGFRDGVFHCEVMKTSNGPRIIEVNPRMGGGPIWNLHKVASGIDLVEETLFTSLRIQGNPSIPRAPKRCVSCSEKFFERSMIVPKEYCKVVEAIRLFPNVVEASPLVEAGERIVGISEGFPTRTARFIVYADTPMEAQHYANKLLDVCDIPQVIKAQRIGAPLRTP